MRTPERHVHLRVPARLLTRGSLAAVVAAVLLAGPALGRPAQPVTTPGVLSATSAVASDDVWAAGYEQAPDSTVTPLAEHWDGSAWSHSQTPLPAGRSHGMLNGIAAVAQSHAWAVGSSTADADGSVHPLAEHWNGRRWQVTPTPEPGGASYSTLQAVTALSDTDVWAVGLYYDAGDGGSIIEHWDGAHWTIVPNADPADAFHASLLGVSALSARNVWATGYDFDPTGAGVTLVEHWNGRSWRHVSSPNTPASPDTELHAVAVHGRDDIWATGFTTVTGSTFLPLTEHWDGTSWTIVRSVIPPGSQNTYLYGIDARATRDAWVTGYYYSSGSYLTLAEHWNGTRWRIVPTPNLSGAISNALLGVTSLTKDDAWASGYSYSSGDVPLIAHWDGTRWTSVPPASGLSAK